MSDNDSPFIKSFPHTGGERERDIERGGGVERKWKPEMKGTH